MGTATFKFSSSAMNDSLRQLHPTCPNATPFDFLSALFWTRVCHSKLKSSSINAQQTHHSLSICIDSRTLLKPPLPAGYMGNAFHFSLLSLDVRDMQESSSKLGHIAALVHTHLEGIGERQIWSTIQWLESHREVEGGGKYREPCRMYGPHLTCVCMEHMTQSLIYGAMFHEEEKPVHVSCHVGNVEGEGLVIVMPSPEGGLGRTVTVRLPEDQLAVLCKDQAILHLQPTMLLTGTPISQ